MPSRLRILVIASEVAPFAKTGGLADVAGALPRALAALGHDVRVMMPKYRGAEAHATDSRASWCRASGCRSATAPRRARSSRARPVGRAGVLPRARALLRPRQPLRHRATATTGTTASASSSSAAPRSRPRQLDAARPGMRWQPQLIHANDWQTGLRARLPAHALPRPSGSWAASPALFTVHNLAYQGVFWHYDMPMTGLGWDLFTPAGLEFYGKLNFLKGGLVFSDLLTTVSRTYAREIRTPRVRQRARGRARGAQPTTCTAWSTASTTTAWNPAEGSRHRPSLLGRRPGAGKAVCREALRRELGSSDAAGPLIGVVTRLAEQKGIDLVLEALPGAARGGLPARGAGLGRRARSRRPSAPPRPRTPARSPCASATTTISRAGSTRAPTRFLMPSRYEPCGLGQLIALRYGAVPIVRRTGGLADTVTEFDPARRTGTGFLFDALHARRAARGGAPGRLRLPAARPSGRRWSRTRWPRTSRGTPRRGNTSPSTARR